jgi:hypothetical protein
MKITMDDIRRLQKEGVYNFQGLTREETRMASMKLAAAAMADDRQRGVDQGLVYGAGRDVFGYYYAVITRR